MQAAMNEASADLNEKDGRGMSKMDMMEAQQDMQLGGKQAKPPAAIARGLTKADGTYSTKDPMTQAEKDRKKKLRAEERAEQSKYKGISSTQRQVNIRHNSNEAQAAIAEIFEFEEEIRARDDSLRFAKEESTANSVVSSAVSRLCTCCILSLAAAVRNPCACGWHAAHHQKP
jgi:hypothetical protein